jgi:hypothetical protein
VSICNSSPVTGERKREVGAAAPAAGGWSLTVLLSPRWPWSPIAAARLFLQTCVDVSTAAHLFCLSPGRVEDGCTHID